MGEENIERLKAVYAEWAKGNLAAAWELYAPDISYEPISDGLEAFPLEEIQDVTREFLAQWKDFRVEAEEFEQVGDTILVTERQGGVGRSSGIEIYQTDYAAWTFRDGLVTRLRWRMDRDAALGAPSAE
jgi:ketosteroid isomerase-like protein